MCESQGMGLCAWGALGRGQFKSAEESNAANREGRKMGPQSEQHRRVALELDELAKRKDTSITGIALAYICIKHLTSFRSLASARPSTCEGISRHFVWS